MSDYIPSLGTVRGAYKNRRPGGAYLLGVKNRDPHAEFDRFIAKVKTEARCEAFQDAQQIIAGDQMVDEARGRDADRVSVGYAIRELDVEIRESVLRIEGEA